jgi:predicted Fe-S protein YdhL (DUF1289 family)
LPKTLTPDQRAEARKWAKAGRDQREAVYASQKKRKTLHKLETEKKDRESVERGENPYPEYFS